MRSRLLLASAAVAVLSMIAPFGHAAAPLCGGTAPIENECGVEGLVMMTDHPVLRVLTRDFVGVVIAEMSSDTGRSEVTCTYKLDASRPNLISSSCVPSRDGIIFKGQTVSFTARISKSGLVPAAGTWAVEYSAS